MLNGGTWALLYILRESGMFSIASIQLLAGLQHCVAVRHDMIHRCAPGTPDAQAKRFSLLVEVVYPFLLFYGHGTMKIIFIVIIIA
jgi:hypothetical protein